MDSVYVKRVSLLKDMIKHVENVTNIMEDVYYNALKILLKWKINIYALIKNSNYKKMDY